MSKSLCSKGKMECKLIACELLLCWPASVKTYIFGFPVQIAKFREMKCTYYVVIRFNDS